MLADGVELLDGRAGAQKEISRPSDLLKGDSLWRECHKGGATTRNQAEQKVLFSKTLGHPQYRFGALDTAVIWCRVAAPINLDARDRNDIDAIGSDQDSFLQLVAENRPRSGSHVASRLPDSSQVD